MKETNIILFLITEDSTYSTYNGFNQLKGTLTGDKAIEYNYNTSGLRVSKTTNGSTITHIWDGSNIAAELDNAGAVKAIYIRGINLIYTEDGAGTKRYFLFNAHGDVVQLTGNTGTLIKAYDYDAFGNEVNPDPADINPFRYCGEYFDKETGTIYLRARYYDPATSRMLSEDSYWGDIRDPLSLNLYTYCKNNPILFIDPSGNTGEAAAAYLAGGWTINFIPVYGQAAYVAGWVGVGVYELVSSPVFPAVCDWTANVAAPWVSNAANDAGNWIANKSTSAWNWLKQQIGGGSGSQDPNKWDKKVTNIKYEISKVADDWQTKGFHIKIDGVEVAMKPGQNGTVVFKQVFSSTSSKAAESAINKAYQLLQDPSIRQQFYQKAIGAKDYLAKFGTDAATAKAGELNFLIKALEKLGVN